MARLATNAQNIESIRQKKMTYPKYRPDIDGLRALAVLLVVIYHGFPKMLPGGFIGVDVFFIISGFLITTIIQESLREKSFSFIQFYIRRARRLFPALIVTLSVCTLVAWFVLLPDEFKLLGKHLASGTIFISNYMLMRESGYFDVQSDTKPLLHLWSLGIEEQFYLIWPLLLWLMSKTRIKPMWLTVALIFISFGFNIYYVNNASHVAFFSIQSRFWELLLGGLFALLRLQRNDANIVKITAALNSRTGRTIREVLSLFGLLLIMVGVYLIDEKTPFPGWFALFPTLGTLSIIATGRETFLNSHVLSARILVWLGLISFPLYLWHWPILSIMRIVNEGNTSNYAVSVAIIISIALAWITFKFVEKPVRNFESKYWLTGLCLSMASIFAIGLTVFFSNGIPSRNHVENLVKVEASYEWNYSTNENCVKKFPFEDAKKYLWWFCMMSKANEPTVLLLGNSFANH